MEILVLLEASGKISICSVIKIKIISWLYSADGDPNINVVSLAMVDYNGTVFWQPPSMYKSLCEVKNFPVSELL